MKETLDILRETPLFKSLDSRELEAVTKCVRYEEFAADRTVIEESTPGEALFIVRSGRVRVEKHVVLAMIGRLCGNYLEG